MTLYVAHCMSTNGALERVELFTALGTAAFVGLASAGLGAAAGAATASVVDGDVSVHVFKLVVGVCVKKLGCFQVIFV